MLDLGQSIPFRRNTLGAGDTVRGSLAYGLWAYEWPRGQFLVPPSIARVMLTSCTLATLKCYAGSFVDFLRVIQTLRSPASGDVGTRGVWELLWGIAAAEPASREGEAEQPQSGGTASHVAIGGLS